jgi:hypothetical protein
MRCPGQDRAYWKADAVFEVPCPQCGASVEFFKDESSGRCTACGHRFLNPGADFGCAEWCSLAKECVGFVVGRASAPDSRPESTQGALAARLIQAVRDESGGDCSRIARAVSVFRFAKELIVSEGGDPRVILAAALLLETASSRPEGERPQGDDLCRKARGILRRIGLDGPATDRVCEILAHCQTDGELDTNEFRVVADADTLASLAAEGPRRSEAELESHIERGFKTASGRRKARSLFQA